ncbi:MAG: GNAT family N-acetyltransferase [Gammaproteobacteria bacterium]
MAETLEWDGLDAACRHVLAITAADEPVGTGRLQVDGRIGRMAVLAAWRGKGIGKSILAALLQQAELQHQPRVYLHAQVRAIDFYLKTGFETVGSPFTEAGIEHVCLEKILAST